MPDVEKQKQEFLDGMISKGEYKNMMFEQTESTEASEEKHSEMQEVLE